jgi:hypothetical protein
LVVVYRVPGLGALDANTLAVRLERWRLGAEHAGWKFGWRDASVAGDPGRRYVETYCYAFAGRDFLPMAQWGEVEGGRSYRCHPIEDRARG